MFRAARAVLVILATSAFAAACMSAPQRQASRHSSLVAPSADPGRLREDAQAVVHAVADAVARARGASIGEAPTVDVRNTPQLIFFSRSRNQIVVPWWGTLPAEMRPVFRTFAGGGDVEGERFFHAFFNRFLIAHEAGHWFQDLAKRREPTLYENERMANRFAVAFWRTQPGGERLLAELERLATGATANLVDPTPEGQDAGTYFEANYQALGREPLKYGYYQFRFIRDALRQRAALDFARLVADNAR